MKPRDRDPGTQYLDTPHINIDISKRGPLTAYSGLNIIPTALQTRTAAQKLVPLRYELARRRTKLIPSAPETCAMASELVPMALENPRNGTKPHGAEKTYTVTQTHAPAGLDSVSARQTELACWGSAVLGHQLDLGIAN